LELTGEGVLQAVAAGGVTDKASSDAGLRLDFAELFQVYHPRIYNYFRYRLDSQEDAEDLTAQTFERAYTHRGKFNARKGTFPAWLYSIAHNILANHYRTRQRRSAYEAEGDLPADLVTPVSPPETQVIQAETIGRLLRNLRHLSERDQEVITLKFAGQLSNKEIGQVMGLKEKTVSVVLWRAMQRLHHQLEETAT
jgi:RNA polymerase sigma-70 factor (ECF subfamily)